MSSSGILVDTNVASFFIDQSRDSGRYRALVRAREMHLSIISVGELRFGAVKDNWGDARRSRLESFVDDATVVYVCIEIAEVVANVMNSCRRKGRRLDWNDGWIAATAIFHQLPLVTHDRDFQAVEGLEVVTALPGFEIREPSVAWHHAPLITADMAMEWVQRNVEAERLTGT